MATTTERYDRATRYAHRAIDYVSGSFWSTSPLDYYANREKTKTAEQDLEKVELRWWRAASDAERERIARDAELLADRIKENLPGAPLDWRRTNLGADEVERTTAATSYAEELSTSSLFDWASHAAGRAADGASRIGALVLLGGGLYVGSQIVGLLRGRQAGSLLRSLERAANRKDGSK